MHIFAVNIPLTLPPTYFRLPLTKDAIDHEQAKASQLKPSIFHRDALMSLHPGPHLLLPHPHDIFNWWPKAPETDRTPFCSIMDGLVCR